LDLSIGDSCREMRLTAAGWTAQQQPERRFFSVPAAALKCLCQQPLILIAQLASTNGQEVVKTAIGQCADLTSAAQTVAHLALTARAREGSAKVGMAKRHVAA